MNDSGYFSSVECSAQKKRRLSLEKDKENEKKNDNEHDNGHKLEPPSMRLGRAEEEIRRMRSSSHDVTTPVRRPVRRDGPPALPASPIHEPTTPAVQFTPVEAPPSLSPTSQLHIHRQNMSRLRGSPLRKVDVSESTAHYSPQFHIPEGYRSGAAPESREFEDAYDLLTGEYIPGERTEAEYNQTLRQHMLEDWSTDTELPSHMMTREARGVQEAPMNDFDRLLAVDEIASSMFGAAYTPAAAATTPSSSAAVRPPVEAFKLPGREPSRRILRWEWQNPFLGAELASDQEDGSSSEDLEDIDLANGFAGIVGARTARTFI